VTRARRSWLACRRGAAAVEFVIAIIPLGSVFFCLVQLSGIMTAKLLVRHAAFVAARAAIVVAPAMHDSGPASDVKRAADMVLAPLQAEVSHIPYGSEDQQMVTVAVTVDYPCKIPIGNIVCCGAGLKKRLTASASMPNQGTYTEEVWPK